MASSAGRRRCRRADTLSASSGCDSRAREAEANDAVRADAARLQECRERDTLVVELAIAEHLAVVNGGDVLGMARHLLGEELVDARLARKIGARVVEIDEQLLPLLLR